MTLTEKTGSRLLSEIEKRGGFVKDEDGKVFLYTEIDMMLNAEELMWISKFLNEVNNEN